MQIQESSERTTSEIAPLAKEFSMPLVIRARDNGGGHTKGEKEKKIKSGVQEKEEKKKYPVPELLKMDLILRDLES